ncbi:hypothetical protein HSX37_05585|uniref:Uncharacterized protein n=1 Tax=Dendrosporobacter quercicolus TaxID=146817 RepID=A0A1G9P2U1_9FIRM|nr:hypothetical protein [Dendrosporobacter quercicolus]NSL47514.1 hypothetical protein [Dendrosporobacter quercicolus DSM 1736]SDL92505.1 hypothetical protein SAMN04488502_1011194 [Dendrosporobacter quercicolus]
MPCGLQIWDANGNLTLDVTDRLTRVLGTFSTGTTDGSHTDAALAFGTPWIHATSSYPYNSYACQYTVSGTTISWTFIEGSPFNQDGKRPEYVIYGVY